jgi:Protein of unknown function (DUF1242)
MVSPSIGSPPARTHLPIFLTLLFYPQSALFNFQSLLLVILLFICTCAYMRATAPGLIDRNKQGFMGLFFKGARIGEKQHLGVHSELVWLGRGLFADFPLFDTAGERLSPYVSISCIIMACYMIF